MIGANALPFSEAVDTTAASSEPNEPLTPCQSLSLDRTAWYKFTPASDESITVNAGNPSNTVVAVYTGSSVSNLSQVACHFSFTTFHADAGTTYYIQTGIEQGSGRTGTPIQFSVAATPPPTVNFGFFPSDPNTFDNILFIDFSSDPGGLGFSSWTWTFGDGTSSTGPSVSHQYANDGDYTVKLSVETPDGRSGEFSQTVSVRTHDVVIKKFTVPTSARSGQTRQISVGISNRHYPETVQVLVLRSVPNEQNALVGELTQQVPVLPTGRTATFNYNYTFSSADAAVGKVTFFAVANISGHKDALPSDNEAISLPTKVIG